MWPSLSLKNSAPPSGGCWSANLLLDAACKSFALAAAPVPSEDISARRWNVLADDLAYPLAVLKRSALNHNLTWMQAYARRKGVHLAPHGKTTMSPELFQMQLAAGAWGLTFATIFQLGVGVRAGVRRAIIANQVLAPADLAGLRALLQAQPDLEVCFLVDSLVQLQLIEVWTNSQPAFKPFDVLLEIGVAGKRTGCRTLEEALRLAQALATSPAVRLCGVECYEGNAAQCDNDLDVAAVSDLVRRVLHIAQACDAQQLFASDTILLTAGGSAVFDLVLPLLRGSGLSKPVEGVLRSGCYITHDHGHYQRYLNLVQEREGLPSSLLPALEVWTMVQSVPEPGLAFLSCGRRDISYDIELPLPQSLARAGVRSTSGMQATPPDWRITALNDQHAYLAFDPQGLVPAVGDRVVLGLSHPCTTFDKWRWMVIAEDDGLVTGAIQTCF
jgi:D-serine dehydratase